MFYYIKIHAQTYMQTGVYEPSQTGKSKIKFFAYQK